MKKKNLAYIALLAGWIIFCYWLYINEIYPRLKVVMEMSGPAYDEDLPFPFGFEWGSDHPVSGPGFDAWSTQFSQIDSTREVVIMTGLYFRDELDTKDELENLAYRRIARALEYLDIEKDRIVIAVSPQQINADVRVHPFESIRFERIPLDAIVQMRGDTIELCFPLGDQMILPQVCYDQFKTRVENMGIARDRNWIVIGTADGTGIAESADVALERAITVKNMLLKLGWNDDQIRISTGQRNHPLTLRNRCTMVYIE